MTQKKKIRNDSIQLTIQKPWKLKRIYIEKIVWNWIYEYDRGSERWHVHYHETTAYMHWVSWECVLCVTRHSQYTVPMVFTRNSSISTSQMRKEKNISVEFMFYFISAKWDGKSVEKCKLHLTLGDFSGEYIYIYLCACVCVVFCRSGTQLSLSSRVCATHIIYVYK